MNLKEILDVVTSYWGYAVIILGVFGVSIDITPWIKVNPMRWMLGCLGSLLNRDINTKIDKLEDRMDQQEDRQNKEELRQKKYRMTSLHDRLFQAHRYFTSQGKISPADLDNWTMLYTEYRENNGNGTVEHKLNPEILALPIDYEDKTETKI